MGGFFGAVSKNICTNDVFFGTDYHSHLGTKRGGMAFYGEDGFHRAIHNIEHTPFRSKLEGDLDELQGHLGIGVISDMEPQPLLIHSRLGSYAIATVGKINNKDQLIEEAYQNWHLQFMEMSRGRILRQYSTSA
jgi:amidophosphoribosyltransferase